MAGVVLLVILKVLEVLDLLGGVSSFFSSTPPFQQIKGWLPTMTTGFLTFALDLCIIGLLVWILLALFQHRRKAGWLETLADEDSKRIEQRIILVEESKKVLVDLNLTSPHIILQVRIVNGSIYLLTLEEKVENRVTFWNNPLDREPEIYYAENRARKVTIQHGESYLLELRQWIPPHVVDFIQKVRDKVEFGVEKVIVRFTYQDRAGVTKAARLFLGEPFFTKPR